MGAGGVSVLVQTRTETEWDPQKILTEKDLNGFQILDGKDLMLFDKDSCRLTFAVFNSCEQLQKVEDAQCALFSLMGKITLPIQRHSVNQEGVCVGKLCFLVEDKSLIVTFFF